MPPLTFRNSRIVYYGPHSCENCGIDIAVMGLDWGGTAFTYPSGPIYPNTEWHPHVCDPFEVRNQRGREARLRVLAAFPTACPLKVGSMFVIELAPPPCAPPPICDALVLSCCSTFCDTELEAWSSADERIERGLPAWFMHRKSCRLVRTIPNFRSTAGLNPWDYAYLWMGGVEVENVVDESGNPLS